MSKLVSSQRLVSHLDVDGPLEGGDRVPSPPTERDMQRYVPERKRYGHLTDPYFHRGMARKLDRQGGDLNEANTDVSSDAIWYRAAFCPNRTVDPNGDPSHVGNCEFCGGRGFVYWETKKVQVSVSPISFEQHFQMSGTYEEGLMKMVFPSGKTPQRGDKVELLDEARIYDEVLHRQVRGEPGVYRLQFEPLRVERAFVTIPRKEWPLPTSPPGDPTSHLAMLEIPHDNFRLLNDRKVAVEVTIPRGAAITFIYFCRPVFLLEKVLNFSREFFRHVPRDQIQAWTLEQIESPEQGWPLATVARLMWQQDSNERANDNTGHWRDRDGTALKSRTGALLPAREE